MKKFTARHFYKGKYVVINVVNPNRNITRYYEIPKNNIVTINKIEKTFTIDENMITMLNGEPNYFYNSNSTKPIMFYPTKEELQFIEMSPEKLHSGIENNLMLQLFSSFTKSEKLKMGDILSIITIVAVLGSLIFSYLTLSQITEQLNQLQDMFTQLWG